MARRRAAAALRPALTRIGRLTLDDITADDDTVSRRFGAEPVPLPDPVAELLRYHLEQRRNTNTAANADSPWLFPGYRPGQPLHRSYPMKLVRDAGVHLLGGRNSALRQLVLDMPPAIAAQALGYSPHVAEAHARNAGTTWVTYASYRTTITTSTPEEAGMPVDWFQAPEWDPAHRPSRRTRRPATSQPTDHPHHRNPQRRQ